MLGNSWSSYLVGLIEGFFGRRASFNFCVSNAMKNDLKRRWGVSAITVYDRPPNWFSKNTSSEQKINFLHCFTSETLSGLTDEWKFVHEEADGTLTLRENRPFLAVSSTSWTPDEDFSILLDALVRLDKRMTDVETQGTSKTYPKIVVIITGKGPQREFYEERIRNTKWDKVRIFTAWLSADDYPKFLSCADLGVSLHTSTSGLDLPMKVVDMLGSGVPVLAKNFPAIGELIDGTNGLLFDTPEELENLLADLSLGFPGNSKLIDLTKNVKEEAKKNDWTKNWDDVVWPHFENL
ncbi:hypothetical protein niasHT_018196 [Heterodera trifolii]|uniref:Chitobiosyldiphosphodolichol beta-mannosyltransferase n=1 Tax=Heterodera trifolii TaxID=157864 RepID=A0ABD2KYY3_9BILA